MKGKERNITTGKKKIISGKSNLITENIQH
jgi:hypothetical protein